MQGVRESGESSQSGGISPGSYETQRAADCQVQLVPAQNSGFRVYGLRLARPHAECTFRRADYNQALEPDKGQSKQ
jgi:hypothetical protein